MKKFFSFVCAAVLAVATMFAAVGCDGKKYEGKIRIYMPDGAPALAFSELMASDNQLGREVSYNVVAADTIATFVANETADAALLPVNAASKLVGSGEKYKLLSVNTHGNLFVIGKEEAADLGALKGKKVGVVNLANVPGLTFQAILKDKGVSYVTDADGLTAENVLLVGIEGGEIAGRLNASGESKLDFVVAPEPAVSTVTGKVPAIKVRLSLQDLWGGEGYPQAVLVAKTELADDKEFVKNLLDALVSSAEWVKTHATDAVTAISSHLAEGVNPSFGAANLTETVIANCNIRVEKAADAKQSVKDYIAKIKEINAQSVGELKDEFFA